MKHTKIIASLLIGSMVLAQGAFAQGFPGGPQGSDHGPRGDGGGRPQGGWGNHGDRGDSRGPGHDNGHHYGQGRHDNTQHIVIEDRRGAGPDHDWHRGGYVPRDYRSRQYVVSDWRDHRLHEPPRGYHWIQVGGDYVLAAITTGLIMQILLNDR